MKKKSLIIFGVLFFVSVITLDAQTLLEASFLEFQTKKEETIYHLPWVSLGPALNSARVESIQIDHFHPGTFYVAFGSGNLWKTVDHGISWKPIFEDMPSHGIGDIALAPSNSHIIYLGTGESLRKQRNFTLPGNGIYRSEDGGATWQHRGLSENWHVGEIAVHPTDPDIVFVAAMGKFWSEDHVMGIYKTKDGGEHWSRVLYVDEKTRANDIVISPANPDVIYATMWENNIDTSLVESIYGLQSGVYKSDDGGDSWNRLMKGLPEGPKTGRIGVAVSYADPDIAYVLIDNLNKDRNKASEIYKTTNGGQSWQRTHSEDLEFSSVIGWYFSDIYVNPQDDQEIFALGVRIAHSVDGGKTFDFLGGEVQHINHSPAQTLHLDHCEMWINPDNPNQIAVGNDGGFYLSYNKGQQWMHYNNIPAGEFYTITLEEDEPYRIFGGTQDDATVFGSPFEFRPGYPDSWQYLWIDAWSGGDGCVTQLDPDDPNTIYFSMQEGFVMRKDQSSGVAVGVKPIADSSDNLQLHYNFVSPYFISPHQGQTLYHAGNYVFKSKDRGDSWSRISPDLSLSEIRLKKSLAASAFVESPLQPGLLCLGTDHGAFWTSVDDGQHWTERSQGIANNYIRSICASKFKQNRIYLAMTGLDYDDLGTYLYLSEDQGVHWKSISSDLPNQPVNVIIEDIHFPDIIYAGTHRGVFISMDKGGHWHLLGDDCPLVPVADLAINKKDELIIATHGRGIYKVDLSPIYFREKLDSENRDSAFYLYPVLDFKAGKLRTSHKDVDVATVEKQYFYLYLPASGSIDFSIRSKESEIIWNQTMQGERGINTFIFNQELGVDQSLAPYVLQAKKFIKPGEYQLVATFADQMQARSFLVLPNE